MTGARARGVPHAIVATVVAIGLAVLCWMSAQDRVTAESTQPQKAHFGGRAAAQVAYGRLAQNDPQGALAAARRAVRTAPVDPSSSSALGSTLLTLGKSDRAYAAFTVTGMLGWRDIPAQFYWLTQAAAVGNVDVIAQRLDALLRLDIRNEVVTDALHQLGRTALGQAALANLLMKDPPWEGRFLRRTGMLEGADLEGRMAAISRAASRGATLDCESVGYAASLLIRDDQAQAAKRLWRQACDRAGDAFLSDGGFEAYMPGRSTSPFTWKMQTEGGLEVDVQPAPAPLRGPALRIRSSMTARTIAARQLTALLPGTYRLSWMTTLENGRPSKGVRALVRCDRSGELTDPALAETAGAGHIATTFSVPAEGCPIQIVAIQTAASSPGEMKTGWIDDIGIEPIGIAAANATP